MKNLTTLLTGLLLGATLFTSCSKEDHVVNPSMTPGAQPLASARTAAQPMAQITDMHMHANIRIMSSGALVYQTQNPVMFDMASSVADMSRQGIIGDHSDLEVFLHTAPGGAPYLTMNGYAYNSAGARIPVNVEIRNGFSMHMAHRTATINRETTMAQIMGINMAQLTSAISTYQWDQAKITDGKIYISEDRNKVLYDAIINNITVQDLTWQ